MGFGSSFLRALARHGVLASVLVFVAFGCDGGTAGCGGCNENYVYPQSGLSNGVQAVDDGARMRMTQAALNFLEANIKDILLGALGSDPNNPNVIMISNTDEIDLAGIATLGVGEDEIHPTEIFIDATAFTNGLIIEFVEAGDALRLRVEDVPIGFDARIFTDWGLGNAACDIFGTESAYGGRPFITGVTLDILVQPRVGLGGECDQGASECLKIDVQVQDIDVDPRNTLGAGSIELSEPSLMDCNDDGLGPCSEDCSDQLLFEPPEIECEGVCFIGDLAVDAIAAIIGFVEDLISGFLPPLVEVAIASALEDIDGTPAIIRDRVAAGDLLPTGGEQLDIGFAFSPTGNAFDVNCPAGQCEDATGMDFIFKTGFEAAPDDVGDLDVPHPCVNPIVGADFAARYGAGEFVAPAALPLTGIFEGQPYHLGASLAKASVNQGMFAAYNSGLLCIELDSDAIHELTGGGFALTSGALDALTGGKLRQFSPPTAPVMITLMPSEPPIVTYGEGSEDEGHIILEWNKIEVSFYVLMYEHFARLFAVEADASVQLTMFADPENETLRLAVVDGPNIGNFSDPAIYSELIPDADFAGILDSLLGVAFDAILSEELEFDIDVGDTIGGALGVPLGINFEGIETTPASQREFLNVYLSMTQGTASPSTAFVPAPMIAERPGVMRLVDDETELEPTGELRLVIPGAHEGLEYFAQVDFGTYRGPLKPDEDGVLVVKDPKLSLIGKHTITLRGRHAGDWRSLTNHEPIELWVDPYRPWAELKVEGGAVVASGTDIGTMPAGLTYAWSFDRGELTDFGARSRIPLEELEDVRRVTVVTQDQAGNISRPVTVDLASSRTAGAADRLAPQGRIDVLAEDAGCQSVPAGSALALFGLLALIRRRRP
jgi:uncharacterized protein (TIGR03382 family)